MHAHRLYFIGTDGHFTGVEVIEADDDGDAILAARKRGDPQATELWDGPRKLKVFPATPPGRLNPL